MNTTPKGESLEFYSNGKVKKRLSAFYKTKKQIPIREVEVKVIFSCDPAKKIKRKLEEWSQLLEEKDSRLSSGLSDLVDDLSCKEKAWPEFGMDSFDASWRVPLVEFLEKVPKDSFLMRQLLSDETMCVMETQCDITTDRKTKTGFIKKRKDAYVPATNLGELFSDILPGEYNSVEKKMKKHVKSSYFYDVGENSFWVPPFEIRQNDDVWTSMKPVVLNMPEIGYQLKMISFYLNRDQQKAMKCYMNTAVRSDASLPQDQNFEKSVSKHRYQETRYLYVDLTQCHVKINCSDLLCFLSFLEHKKEADHEEKNKKDIFTSTNHVVATYIADYLGLVVFQAGWRKIQTSDI